MMTLESIPLDGTNGVRIEILERSETTLVIRWVEPGRCHYGEQRWRRRSLWLRSSADLALFVRSTVAWRYGTLNVAYA